MHKIINWSRTDRAAMIIGAAVALVTLVVIMYVTGDLYPVVQWYGRTVEWTVSTVTLHHVTLYGEPFHSGQNGGFVSYIGAGHCFGVEWYGTPGFFTGCDS